MHGSPHGPATSRARPNRGLSTCVPPRVLTNADLGKAGEDDATSGSCSGPGSASGTSSSRAWRRRTSPRWPPKARCARPASPPRSARLHRRRHDDARTRSFRARRACCRTKTRRAANAWGFDLGAACSGFTYSLNTAAQMVATGAVRLRARGRRRRRCRASSTTPTARPACCSATAPARSCCARGRGRAAHHRLRAT